MAHVLLELLALVILIAIIYKPLSKVILGGLDGHAAKVRAELDAAKRLREEAQSLLSGYQRQLASGEDQARAIVEHARAETERQVERHRAELEASLRRRTEQAMGRIAQEEARALQEMRAHAATLAIRTTERLLRERIDGPTPRPSWMARSNRSAASCPDREVVVDRAQPQARRPPAFNAKIIEEFAEGRHEGQRAQRLTAGGAGAGPRRQPGPASSGMPSAWSRRERNSRR